jgi:hypothetical protein
MDQVFSILAVTHFLHLNLLFLL